MASRAENQVRARREQLGLTQAALAARVRVSRQSVNAIEAGRATPAVDVALRLAAALEARVEELFGAPSGGDVVPAVAASPEAATVGTRVALARVGGRLVAHALFGDDARVAADGVVAVRRSKTACAVSLWGAGAAVDERVLLTGCAPALGVIADRLNARNGPGRFMWRPTSSAAALAALAHQDTHVAGVHQTSEDGDTDAVPDVRGAATHGPVAIIALARWQEGLLTRPADGARIRTVADLGRPAVRMATREAGAGAQRLLERSLKAAGVPMRIARSSALRAAGHLDVARAIAMGAADAGVATRDAALAYGLRFVPMAEERYDLVLPSALLTDPRVARFFDVLVSEPCRAELSLLGYDVTHSGARVAEVTS